MRADMHKVFAERGHRRIFHRKQFRSYDVQLEERPTKEGIRDRNSRIGKIDRKPNLAPFRRWLRSQAGRLWNDVYSEACRVIKTDGAINARIRTYILDMVERNTFIDDGNVCFYRNGTARPISELSGRWQVSYVNPESGILCNIPAKKRERNVHNPYEKAIEPFVRKVTNELFLIKVEGHWYACEMQPLSRFEAPLFDHVIGAWLNASHAWYVYGDILACVRRWQLSRKDLKRFNLVNTPLEPDSGLQVTLTYSLIKSVKNYNQINLKRQPRGRIFQSITTLAFEVHTFSQTFFDGSQDWVIDS